jgi:hypothetical protein
LPTQSSDNWIAAFARVAREPRLERGADATLKIVRLSVRGGCGRCRPRLTPSNGCSRQRPPPKPLPVAARPDCRSSVTPQDRIIALSDQTILRCYPARSNVRFGSQKGEILAKSRCFPLCPQHQTLHGRQRKASIWGAHRATVSSARRKSKLRSDSARLEAAFARGIAPRLRPLCHVTTLRKPYSLQPVALLMIFSLRSKSARAAAAALASAVASDCSSVSLASRSSRSCLRWEHSASNAA